MRVRYFGVTNWLPFMWKHTVLVIVIRKKADTCHGRGWPCRHPSVVVGGRSATHTDTGVVPPLFPLLFLVLKH